MTKPRQSSKDWARDALGTVPEHEIECGPLVDRIAAAYEVQHDHFVEALKTALAERDALAKANDEVGRLNIDLQNALAAERERCAKVCEDGTWDRPALAADPRPAHGGEAVTPEQIKSALCDAAECPVTDNLAIVLATYYERNLHRPEDDPQDQELGWSAWCMEKSDAALDRIVAAVTAALAAERERCAEICNNEAAASTSEVITAAAYRCAQRIRALPPEVK